MLFRSQQGNSSSLDFSLKTGRISTLGAAHKGSPLPFTLPSPVLQNNNGLYQDTLSKSSLGFMFGTGGGTVQRDSKKLQYSPLSSADTVKQFLSF